MTKDEETFGGLDVNEISGDLIKEELLGLVQKRLKSNNVKICIENGSKIGINSHLFVLILNEL